MANKDSFEVTERRIKISNYIIDGLKPKEILNKLPTLTIEIIYDDIKAIKKKAYKSMTKLSKDGLAFQYENMINQMELIFSETRNRIRNTNDLTNEDFVKLSKLAKETVTEKRELIKESVSIFEIEKYKQDIKELKDQQTGESHKGFMTLDLPKLIHDNNDNTTNDNNNMKHHYNNTGN